MNDDYSLLVTTEFELNELINIEYEVVEQVPDDKYAILDFSTEDSKFSKGLIINKNYFNTTDDIISAIMPDNSGYVYSCVCNSSTSDNVEINDCQYRTYFTYWIYCDGILCNTCSLAVKFLLPDGSGSIKLHNTSVILLPELNSKKI